ncbi:DUF2177 family protein [Variovorax sp. J22R133]|uniref:DUF2177 family protein n=1 Tax=Variovorax brevis TaxID=3053503 RepID=UPI002574C791|nr:DUF2177 family protein [Variovorax sp. J22R133]MDM0111145.1 DUF2177 family protein [Variovorax sp. J22R133]
MNVRQFALAYAAVAVIFLALDAIWLTAMADRLYRPALAHLMRERFDVAPAIVFYALYFVGVVIFAVAPGLRDGDWQRSLGLGALFGLIAYATYDLTNQATLKDWPWHVTVADLVWGSFVTAVAAGIACAVTARFMPSR